MGEKAETGERSKALLEAEGAFDRALGRLETNIRKALVRSGDISRLEEDVQRLSTDRARLAQDLDSVHAKSAKLNGANAEVSRRLVSAMETVRAVLEDSKDVNQSR